MGNDPVRVFRGDGEELIELDFEVGCFLPAFRVGG